MSQSRRAVHGVKWNYISIVGMASAQLLFTAILSRLLSPAAFGLMAMANLMIRFGNYFSAQGVRLYVIQKPNLDDSDIASAFWISAAIGLCLAFVAFLLAPLGGDVFRTPEVEPVIRVMALVYIFTGLSVTSSALLSRSLRFKAMSLTELASYSVGYLVLGIPLALLGMGVYSLVAAILVRQFLLLVGFYALVRHRVVYPVRFGGIRNLVMRGSHYSVNSVLDFAVLSLPTFFVGRVFGDVILGIFNRANQLITLSTNNMSTAVMRVFFPVLTSLRENPQRLRHVYLNGTLIFSLIMLPLCVGMIPAASELVLVVLGPKWTAGIPVFKVLCIGMAFYFATVLPGQYADAHAFLRLRSGLQLATLVVTGTAMWALRSYGLVGVAAGFALGQVFNLGIFMCLLRRWLGLAVADYVAVYGPAVVVGLLASTVVWLVHMYLQMHPLIWTLIAEIIAGAVTYCILLLTLPFNQMRGALGSVAQSFLSDRQSGLLARIVGLAVHQFARSRNNG